MGLCINRWCSLEVLIIYCMCYFKCYTYIKADKLCKYILTSKRDASVTFDTPYCINGRLFLFKEFTISYIDIHVIRNQKCKLIIFQFDTWKVIGRSILRPPYAMPVLIMDYSTRHSCIQSAVLSPHKMNREWCEISIRSSQCKNLSSDAFLGVVYVNATNVKGKSQYFFDRSGCIEKL